MKIQLFFCFAFFFVLAEAVRAENPCSGRNLMLEARYRPTSRARYTDDGRYAMYDNASLEPDGSLILEMGVDTQIDIRLVNGVLEADPRNSYGGTGTHPDLKHMWPHLYFNAPACYAGKGIWYLDRYLNIPTRPRRITHVTLLASGRSNSLQYAGGQSKIRWTEDSISIRDDESGSSMYRLKIYFETSACRNFDPTPKESADSSCLSQGIIEVRGVFFGEVEFIFHGATVTYRHHYGEEPAMVVINGEPWQDLQKTFYLNHNYDFSNARIVKKSSRERFIGINRGGEFILRIKKQPSGHGDISSIDISL